MEMATACAGLLLCALMLAVYGPRLDSPAVRAQGATHYPADVLTQHDDNLRTGAYRQPGLNASVFRNPRSYWGLVGKLPVAGAVYAQPLYVANLRVPPDGTVRSVVFIATSSDTVYAYDARTLRRLWATALGRPDDSDRTASRYTRGCSGVRCPCTTLSPGGIGIQATPVIDPGSRRMYVSYRTRVPVRPAPATGQTSRPSPHWEVHQYLAALDIATGAVRGRVRVDATTVDAQGGPLDVPLPASFKVDEERNRAGLLLLDGAVFLAFSSRCEELDHDFHGWMFAYDVRTLRRVGIYNTTPSGSGGGIWQGSNGPAADGSGNIYLMTGNDGAQRDWIPDPTGTNLGDSFIRLHVGISRRSPDFPVSRVTMRTADWFTPYRAFWHNVLDLDLGSSGPVLIPGTHLLVGGGKEGMLYLVDRSRMGHLDTRFAWRPGRPRRCVLASQCPDLPSADHVVQKFQAGRNQYLSRTHASLPMGNWLPWPRLDGSPVYWDFHDGRGGLLYVWPEKDYLKAFRRSGNRFVPAGQAAGPLDPNGFAQGGILSLSVDPGKPRSGIVWASVPVGSMIVDSRDGTINYRGSLHAYDASTLRELWSNAGNASYRFAKFCPPTVAGGRVYLATFSNEILVYGMKPHAYSAWQKE